MTPDEARTELAVIRAAIDRRDAVVQDARAAGLTWAEIGTILGMTPHGLIKASRRRE
ncbi:hypothetical protein ACPW96_20225 [Micromonospora sp. DT81.3]|uniref:hypothetical protein n=1 Tax=Micromonospora sp. DT81.3 TaxID=3416523 RepID=UPI003CF69567